jgi:hypothetical protein
MPPEAEGRVDPPFLPKVVIDVEEGGQKLLDPNTPSSQEDQPCEVIPEHCLQFNLNETPATGASSPIETPHTCQQSITQTPSLIPNTPQSPKEVETLVSPNQVHSPKTPESPKRGTPPNSSSPKCEDTTFTPSQQEYGELPYSEALVIPKTQPSQLPSRPVGIGTKELDSLNLSLRTSPHRQCKTSRLVSSITGAGITRHRKTSELRSRLSQLGMEIHVAHHTLH